MRCSCNVHETRLPQLIDKNKLFWDQFNSKDCLEFISILQFGLQFSFETLNLWNLGESNPHKLDIIIIQKYLAVELSEITSTMKLASAKTQHQTRKSSVFQYRE